jgi:hypothetical protein
MKKINALLIFLLCTSWSSAEELPGWRELALSLGSARIKTVITDGKSGQDIYVGTDKGVYITRRERSFITRIPTLSLRSDTNALFIKEDGGTLLAATEVGAYESRDQGKTWRGIYNGSAVLAIASADDQTFIGTADGVYAKKDNEEYFSRLPGRAGREASYVLRTSSHRIYSLGAEHLYLIRPETRAAEIIFSISGSEEEAEETDDEPKDSTEKGERYLRAIEIFEGTVYVASARGIFVSGDSGKTWQEVPSDGLVLSQVNDLALVDPLRDKGTLCAGTDQELSCRINGVWRTVDDGIPGGQFRCLLEGGGGDLFAATEKGIYVLPQANGRTLASLAHEPVAGDCQFKDYASFERSFSNEPSIHDVHALAVRYSDTDQKKIAAWHRQSRAKGLVPHVSVGLDRDTGDLLHWDTGPNPDRLQKGREHRDWDLTVTWELADLIWSTDQTSIDSRSKLMAELREEVLDQVTRIYFERRRLQIELVSCVYPAAGERMAAEMRVHELTALIDAYTGGEFTSRLNHRSNSKTQGGQV